MSAHLLGHNGAKLAVTVLLIRDGSAGLEVFVQERVSSMPTFPNTTVFPGGGVDPRDFEAPEGIDPHWRGPDVSLWAHKMEVDSPKARALIMAACRELFEEAGTLLCSELSGRLIYDVAPYHPQRLALESHRLSFSQVLSRNDLVLRTDLLRPLGRWVSPEEDPHQFDMYSFITLAPPGQEPDGRNREASSSGWFDPGLILDGWRAGLLRLVIPTWAELSFLSGYRCVADVVAALKTTPFESIFGHPRTDERFREYYDFTPLPRF